jgi:hypothetical protein
VPFENLEEVQLLREILVQLMELNAKTDNTAVLASIDSTLVTISDNLAEFLSDWKQANIEPGPVKAVLALRANGDSLMSISVDDTTGNAVLGFEDDKGDATGPPPGDGSGLVVTFASDNSAVATVGTAATSTDAAGNTTYETPIVPVAEGSFNLSATVANTSGAALTDADGTTAFVQPSPLAVTVTAGQAASGSLSVTG